MRFFRCFSFILACLGFFAFHSALAQEKASALQDILFDVGPVKDQILYHNQPREAFDGAGASVMVLTPSGTVYFDRERSSPGKLCVRYELQSSAYLSEFKSKLNTAHALVLPQMQSLTLYLAPVDEADPPYSWVKPRSDNAAATGGTEFLTCFDIGTGRDPEAVARASMIRAYYTTNARTGNASQCSVSVSLKDLASRSADAKSFTTTGTSPDVLISGAQLTNLLSSKGAKYDVTCSGANAEAVKIVRDQIGNAIPKIMARMDTTEVTWEALKGQMWNLGFSTSADTVIDKVKKYTNQTVSTRDLDVKANDLLKLGITAKDGKTITENDENSTSTKVTIPASIQVYRFGKSNLSHTENFSMRELNVTGNTAATLFLRSRFVEGGVLRTVKQFALDQFPANAVVAWYGNKDSELPVGWGMCDGREYSSLSGARVKTPDLRGRFLREGAGGLGNVGGQESVETDFRVSVIEVNTLRVPECRKESHNSNKCLEAFPSKKLLEGASGKPVVATIPPYVNVAYICKLPL